MISSIMSSIIIIIVIVFLVAMKSKAGDAGPNLLCFLLLGTKIDYVTDLKEHKERLHEVAVGALPETTPFASFFSTVPSDSSWPRPQSFIIRPKSC